MSESRFYYVEGYQEFGLINLNTIRRISPNYFQGRNRIRVDYKGSGYDFLDFGENLLARDGVLRHMMDTIFDMMTSREDLEDAIEEIEHENQVKEMEKAEKANSGATGGDELQYATSGGTASNFVESIQIVGIEKEFIDPTDISKFPTVKVD